MLPLHYYWDMYIGYYSLSQLNHCATGETFCGYLYGFSMNVMAMANDGIGTTGV